MFCKKDILKNFEKIAGKHLYQIIFFDKVVDLRPTTLLKKTVWHMCFPVNFVKFFRNSSGGCFYLILKHVLVLDSTFMLTTSIASNFV